MKCCLVVGIAKLMNMDVVAVFMSDNSVHTTPFTGASKFSLVFAIVDHGSCGAHLNINLIACLK